MSQDEDPWGKLTLTARQAFMVMHCFLARYYQATHADEAGGLLGGLSLLPDGSPADAGFQREWLDAVETVIAAEQVSGYQQADLRLKNESEKPVIALNIHPAAIPVMVAPPEPCRCRPEKAPWPGLSTWRTQGSLTEAVRPPRA